jgi:MFS family permease
MLGTLAFLLLLAEGSAMDWSNLHAQQHLGVSPSAGALALGCFVAAMTVGRFSVDRIAPRVGPVRTVRWGSATAVLGIAIVTVSPVLPLTLIGWAVLGWDCRAESPRCSPQPAISAAQQARPCRGWSARATSRSWRAPA